MKKYIALFLFFAATSSIHAQDSLTTITPEQPTGTAFVFGKGDTLADFNKINGGVVKYQVSEESKNTLDSNGLSIESPGVIKVVEPSSLHFPILLEVKTFASDNEWYINTLKVTQNKSGMPVVYISADKIDMATGFRKEGKIYVVITVVGILFAIVFLYLFYLDKKTKTLLKKL